MVIVTALWKRPELTKVIQDYYAKYFNDCVLIAVKSPDDPQPENDKWVYVEYPNKPVAQKFNAGFLKAREYSPEFVVLIGSDDLISRSLIDYYKANYPSSADYLLGLRDLYYYDSFSKQALHSKQIIYKKDIIPIGCGRAFSKSILDKMDWKPYGKMTLSSGLDTNSTRYMEKLGIKNKTVTMKESNAVCVDIKTNDSMHDFNTIIKHYGKYDLVDIQTLDIFKEQLCAI